MSSELDQRMQALKEEMEQLEKQKQVQERKTAAEAVRKRIFELREISKDPYYNQFLERLLFDLENRKATIEQVSAELERTYIIYQNRMKEQVKAEPVRPVPSQPVTPKPVKNSPTFEFTVGAGLLSIVGALFLLIAFITFGLNFLEGLAQGIFLYVLSIAVVFVSELLIQRKVPRFARGITGLGIAGLYASTIINYMYLKTINSLAALVITIIIAIISMLLSRKKDSTSIRLISFIGCYICFLPMNEFKTDLEFLVAIGILFLVNVICVFFPNQKNKNLIHLIHMGLNTFLSIIFLVAAHKSGIGVIYIILYIMLNIILLNIVYLKQEKKVYNTILFCVELGICGVLTFIFTADVFKVFQAVNIGIYHRMITIILALAVCIFFYILNQDRKGKTIQYYYFMSLSLMLFAFSTVKLENLFGVLVLFVVAKLLAGKKELEVMNCIITLFAFVCGLCYYDIWQGWLLFGAFLLSILFVKRWRLFYQYIISLFLIFFIALNTTYDVFIPICAAVLFGLMFVFHLWGGKNETIRRIYNITNLCTFGLISLSAVFCHHVFSGTITMAIGAVYIILYLSPKYGMDIKKKYLILAGYLTCMTFLIGFQSPIYVSILLMVIAISCVVVGFKIKDKVQRLCGIVLALFVCLKLVLYDLRGLESLQRIILFMVVGSIALAISLIYIQLEKGQNEPKVKHEAKTKPEETGATNEIDKIDLIKEVPEVAEEEPETRKEDRDESEGKDEI